MFTAEIKKRTREGGLGHLHEKFGQLGRILLNYIVWALASTISKNAKIFNHEDA